MLPVMSRGVVDPRTEEEKQRELAALRQGLLGKPWSVDPVMHADQGGGGLLNTNQPAQGLLAAPSTQPTLPDSTNQPTGPALDPQSASVLRDRLMSMAGEAPKKKDNTLRDILAGSLAVMSDAFAQRAGIKGDAADMVAKQWGKRRETYQDQMQQWQERQRIASLPGMTEREMAAFMADPKGWGGHMADAYSTHYAAANLNPGDQRVFGNPNAGGAMYQAPTAAEQYATSLGQRPGSEGYDAALQDYTLRANGPTAFGFDKQLDDHRTSNDMRIEDMRQGNRLQLRGAPTWRQANPAPPRVTSRSAPRKFKGPSATGPNGQKIYLQGGRWVDDRGRPIQ